MESNLVGKLGHLQKVLNRLVVALVVLANKSIRREQMRLEIKVNQNATMYRRHGGRRKEGNKAREIEYEMECMEKGKGDKMRCQDTFK